MIVEAICQFHPMFAAGGGVEVWLGGTDEDWGRATIEGGDVMPSARAWSSSAWASAPPTGRVAPGPPAVPGRGGRPRAGGGPAPVAPLHAPRHRRRRWSATARCAPIPGWSRAPRCGRCVPATRRTTSSSSGRTRTWSSPWAATSGSARCTSSPPGATTSRTKRAVGRRQQRAGARAGRRRGLRAQHLHQHQAPQGRHRGHHHAGVRGSVEATAPTA